MSNSTAVLEKLRRFKTSRPQGYSGGKTKGIFHTWKTGDNHLRLAGGFLEMRSHFIAPAPKRNDRGLCRADAFQGENSLQQTINCLDWDVAKEEIHKPFSCPICRLAELSRLLLKDQSLSEEEKKFFLALRNAASQRQSLKWNIIDRDDPYILFIDESGEEKRVKGYKIANIGMEVYKDIDGIFEQCGFDISDPTGGIDITVKRSEASGRTTYSAQAVLEKGSNGIMTVKVTPLTAEELAMPLHDMKIRCGKMTTVQAIMDGLHEDLRQLLEVNTQDDAVEESEEVPPAEHVAEISAPAETDEAAAIDSALGEDVSGQDNLNMEPQAAQAEPTPEPEPPPVQSQPAARVAKPALVRQPLPPIKQVAAPVKPATAPVRPVVAPAKPAAVAAPAKVATATARPVTAPARTVAGVVRKPIVLPTQKKT